MNHPLNPTWNLEPIFAGGSTSEQLQVFLGKLTEDIDRLASELKQQKAPQQVEETQNFDTLLEQLQDTRIRLREAGSFAGCLTAQDQSDKQATRLSAALSDLSANLQALFVQFQSILVDTSDEVFAGWIERPQVASVAFYLNEIRAVAREKMSPELESLALGLAVDGYHGWSDFYDTIVSHVRIPFEQNGETVMLSAGQAANKMSDRDRNIREEIFRKWEEAWTGVEDFCADTLNHIGGFRLKLYDRRGWDSVLKEPLAINRMSQQTLDTMWDVIVKNKPVFVSYLERKAQVLGVDRLSWNDVEAPIGNVDSTLSYDDAADLIVEQFRKFNPEMADFAAQAFEKRWIEAEDRAGKRPGGFCTSLPLSKETRIFMTYSGTASNVSTLAHELGHGYHQHVMNDLPAFSQQYAMNVAETASTFAEMIVADSLVKEAKSEEEKLSLLEDKIQRSIAFFMNIHARFLFETRFYEQRRSGMVGSEELSQLMEEAQREAFCDTLSSYHPHFWASKLHFYKTGVPFYNFPYTFGYLFSTGIYALAQREGAGFAAKYDALLQDTGRMTVEELAQKHLGVDLTQPEFWQGAVDVGIADVQLFLEMTASYARS
ncbi:M3 family oligoendopeptidase [Paenibacillus wulumuqiensis]|uniref:M3 family oligoendopeptidase n=1 Tax=Paenibacillus wulumuqiensis TaxID=1567107 RepID=UPI0006196A9B|nr:M3 family oligoendopeptidase [Paenibacillus wulumuqiensis]